MSRSRALAALAASFALLASARASARGCSERSESRAVGLADCRRFGDWDYDRVWTPSFALAFLYRSIPQPRTIDVCIPHGKSCTSVGPPAVLDAGPRLGAYTGALDVSVLSLGPFRLGLELDVGATDRGLAGARAGAPFHTDLLVYGSGAAILGASFGFSAFGFRLEGLGGGAGLWGSSNATDASGATLRAGYGAALLEGRATASVWVTPWISLGVTGGYGLGEVWHLGGAVRVALLPYDGARP